MRFVVAAVLCLLTACCVSIPNRYEVSKQTTVRLEWPNGAICSGVATGAHSIITASHCTEAGGLSGKVKINDKDSEFAVIADDLNDHVILRVTQRQEHVARIGHARFRPGDTLYLWGQPQAIDGVLRFGRIAGGDKASDLCLSTLKRTTCAVIYLDANLTHGDSGGAFFNMRGELVGIESGGYTVPQHAFKLPFFYEMTFTPAQLKAARQ